MDSNNTENDDQSLTSVQVILFVSVFVHHKMERKGS